MRLLASQLISSVAILATLASCVPNTAAIIPSGKIDLNNTTRQAQTPTAQSQTAQNQTLEQPTTNADSQDTPQLLPAGKHCYTLDTTDNTRAVQLTLDNSGNIIGAHSGYSHDPENNYQIAYSGTVDGTLLDKDLQLNVISQVESSLTGRTEVWQIRQDDLHIRENILSQINCDHQSNLDCNNNFILSDLNPNANQISNEQVYFKKGRSSATLIAESIRDGDYVSYSVRAQKGQHLSLETLQQQDVNFSLVSPSQILLGRELVYANIVLPETGDYQILASTQTSGIDSAEIYIGIK